MERFSRASWNPNRPTRLRVLVQFDPLRLRGAFRAERADVRVREEFRARALAGRGWRRGVDRFDRSRLDDSFCARLSPKIVIAGVRSRSAARRDGALPLHTFDERLSRSDRVKLV